MTAEEWLKENCESGDFPLYSDELNESMPTRAVLKYMKEYARIKCLETANKVKSECCKILDELPVSTWHTQSLILNIPDKDILPEI